MTTTGVNTPAADTPGTGDPAPGTTDAPETPQPRSRFASALVWSYIFTVGRFGITGVMTVVLAKILDPASFGVLYLALVWVFFLQMLMHNAALPLLQQPGIDDRHNSAALKFALASATLLSLVLAGITPLLSRLNHTQELTPVLLGLIPVVILEASCVVPDARLRRALEWRWIAIRGTVSALAGALAALILALGGYGVWALVFQQVTTSGVYAAMTWLIKPWRPTRGPVLGPLREMRATATQSSLGFLGYFAATRVDVILMGIFYTPVAIGLYRFAGRLVEIGVEVSSRGMQQVSLPHLADAHADREALIARLATTMRLNAILAFPLFGLLFAAAGPGARLLGGDWTHMPPVLRLLCLGGTMTVVHFIIGNALLAAQRTDLDAIVLWIGAALSAGGMTAVALTTDDLPLTSRLVWLAVVTVGLQIALNGLTWLITFRYVLRVSSLPIVRAGLPGLLAGLAAAVAGSSAPLLLADTAGGWPRLILGVLAGGTAAGVVFVLLPDTRGLLLRLPGLSRFRPAPTLED